MREPVLLQGSPLDAIKRGAHFQLLIWWITDEKFLNEQKKRKKEKKHKELKAIRQRSGRASSAELFFFVCLFHVFWTAVQIEWIPFAQLVNDRIINDHNKLFELTCRSWTVYHLVISFASMKVLCRNDRP